MKTKVLQIQRITLTSQDTIHEVEGRQRELQREFQQLKKHAQQTLEQTQTYIKQRDAHTDASLIQMKIEQRHNFAALQDSFTTSMQPLLAQMEQIKLAVSQSTPTCQQLVGSAHSDFHSPETTNSSAVRISATITSQQCPSCCRCQCHVRSSICTPSLLRSVFGQLLWTYNSPISMRCCNYPPCRKSLGKHHLTYYFPPWLVSRAIVASANLDDLFGTGAKMSVNIPLIIPEEDHIVWSLVTAGNLEQLSHLLSHDKNLIHVRNQWGQSIMHVRNTSDLFRPSIAGCALICNN